MPPDHPEEHAVSTTPDGARRRLWLELLGIAILVCGLAVGAWILSTVPDTPTGTLGYALVDGQSYPVATTDNKAYRHEMERIGGKSALLVDDFSQWVSSWWHGRRLALTLVLLSGASALLCFWLAERWYPKKEDAPPSSGPPID